MPIFGDTTETWKQIKAFIDQGCFSQEDLEEMRDAFVEFIDEDEDLDLFEDFYDWCDDLHPDEFATAVKANNERAKKHLARGKLNKYTIYWKYRSQKGRCFYCEGDIGYDVEIDHVKPLSHGGSNHDYNVVLACKACNHKKSTRDALWFFTRHHPWLPSKLRRHLRAVSAGG